MSEGLLKSLDLLAGKLGTTSEQLWGILVAQAHIAVIESMITAIGGVLLLIVCRVVWRKGENANCDDTASEFIAIIGGVLGVILIGYGFFSMITPLLNPDYYALQRILDALGN